MKRTSVVMLPMVVGLFIAPAALALGGAMLRGGAMRMVAGGGPGRIAGGMARSGAQHLGHGKNVQRAADYGTQGATYAYQRFQQRNLSLTAQARSAEVELTMTVALSLRQGSDELIPEADAQVVRQFLNDPRNVVGKTEELRLLREEMRRDLAAQIARRITHSLGN